MNEAQKVLNEFLVKTFNVILRQEEKSLEKLCDGKLSVKEFHVIEAINNGCETLKNSMSDVASALDITLGTLTVAVKRLEQKAYVKKIACQNDKRSAKLFLTNEGIEINKQHANFHTRMIYAITKELSSKEQKILTESLVILEDYFMKGSFKSD